VRATCNMMSLQHRSKHYVRWYANQAPPTRNSFTVACRIGEAKLLGPIIEEEESGAKSYDNCLFPLGVPNQREGVASVQSKMVRLRVQCCRFLMRGCATYDMMHMHA